MGSKVGAAAAAAAAGLELFYICTEHEMRDAVRREGVLMRPPSAKGKLVNAAGISSLIDYSRYLIT